MLTRYKPLVTRSIEPLATWLASIGVSPLALTLTAPVLSSLICFWFFRTRAVIPFCIAIVAAGCFDVLDGAVARASGRVTKFGAYLDAICDRYVEIIVTLTVAAVTGYWALSFMVLSGALMVSYAKARAAMEVPISNQEWPDLMERTERSLLFVAGLAASRLMAWTPLGHDLFWWTLVCLAIAIHATVVQRILRARRLITTRSNS